MLFLSFIIVVNKYGPLFIELVIEISIEFIPASKILSIIVSFNSVPILNIPSGSLLIFTSLWRNLPNKDSFEIRMSFKPSSNSFFALRKFIFSPSLITVFPVFASIISSETFLAL